MEVAFELWMEREISLVESTGFPPLYGIEYRIEDIPYSKSAENSVSEFRWYRG